MEGDQLEARYRELQSYVGWTNEDAQRIKAVSSRLVPYLPPLIDDFFLEIEKHEGTRRVITGGREQIQRLKGTLMNWLQDLLSGQYDREYVERRWRVGYRHVEIGLEQVYTNVALSRLRTGLVQAIQQSMAEHETAQLKATVRSLNKLLDLDLAIIEDAYQAEYAFRLQQTERLATLGQVSGGIAHELRNPLNVVRTSVYYLLHARNPTPEKQAEHLQRIERNVDLANHVITALSGFAKMPVPQLRPTDLASAIQDALEVNPPVEGISVFVNCPSNLPPALADPDQLRIVFGNLIRNACDAMAKVESPRLEIRCQSLELEEKVLIEVKDNGVGIPSEDLSRITEPLYSTKARGLGLGLAIVRTILEKSGGALRATSHPGRGSTFEALLQAASTQGEGG